MKMRTAEIRTDSPTVLWQVESVTTNWKRIRTKGDTEIVIKCHLGILGELAAKFALELHVVFVSSEKNKAEVLTRVEKN